MFAHCYRIDWKRRTIPSHMKLQPKSHGTFHPNEFDPRQLTMHPPHKGFIDWQRVVLIGSSQVPS
jgi:hypothetical protein